MGFEPTVGLPLLLISSQVPLTTQPPFQPLVCWPTMIFQVIIKLNQRAFISHESALGASGFVAGLNPTPPEPSGRGGYQRIRGCDFPGLLKTFDDQCPFLFQKLRPNAARFGGHGFAAGIIVSLAASRQDLSREFNINMIRRLPGGVRKITGMPSCQPHER